jgi:UDP-N-acetylglucosamine 3-dehydrogenase
MMTRLGLVGRGRWSKNIARTLVVFADVTVETIAKTDQPPKGLDGVLIATESATHADVAVPFVAAGIPTFIEKPMATSIADAERIRAAAERSGAAIFVGHIFLYHPAFLAALELLPELGAVRYLLCEGTNDTPRADSSVLWDWLPHDLSMAHAIFGCHATGVTAWKLAGDAAAQAAVTNFRFGDVPVVSLVSWLSPLRRRRTTIAAEAATLVFDDKVERRLTLHERNGDVTFPAYADEAPLTRELAAFVETVRSGRADTSHLEIGMATVRSIAAAEKSIAAGGRTIGIAPAR